MRRRAYNVNDIYNSVLRNYAINTCSFESAKNCSLRDARYCWRNKNYITCVSRTFAPYRRIFFATPSRFHQAPTFFVHRPHVTPISFVRTEVDRLNCEFRDNYAPRGNPGAWRARKYTYEGIPSWEAGERDRRCHCRFVCCTSRSKIMRPDNWQRAIDIRFVSTVNKILGVLLITHSARPSLHGVHSVANLFGDVLAR